MRTNCGQFVLIAARNAYICGYHGDPTRECTCFLGMVEHHQKRISGPLMDRIDIHVEATRGRQRKRLEGTSLQSNADMGPAEARESCELDDAGRGLIKAAMRQLGLSARGYHRVLKLSRTIADLAGSEQVEPQHLAEALQYRRRQGE